MAQTKYETTGSVGSYQDGVDFMRMLAREPSTVPWRMVAVGRTVQGRTIWAASVGPDPAVADDVVLVTASIHSGELSCRETALQYLRQLVQTADEDVQEYFQTVCWIIIPTTQGDTYGQHDKKNAAGVDINQDGLALSQPETRAIASLVQRYPNLTMVVDHHEGAMTADCSIASPTAPYGVHDAIQSASDALRASMIATLRAHSIDAVEWYAWDTLGRYRNTCAADWKTPHVLLETSVNYPVAQRVTNMLVAVEAARTFHAANSAMLRVAVEEARADVVSPQFIATFYST